MTNYYVRLSGSDAADGLSAANAWATLVHAMDTISAGDTVYIGAGVHEHIDDARTAYGGTLGSPIVFQGDPHGKFCGDGPGPVCLINKRSNLDWQQPEKTHLIHFDGDSKHFEFHDIVFLGSGINAATTVEIGQPIGNFSMSGVVFEDCMFFKKTSQKRQGQSEDLMIDYGDGATPTGNGLRIRRCLFTNDLTVTMDDNGVAGIDVDALVESCVTTRSSFIAIVGQAGTYTIKGTVVRNCSAIAAPDSSASAFRQSNILEAGSSEWHNCLMEGDFYINIFNGVVDSIVVTNSIVHNSNASGNWSETAWDRTNSKGVIDGTVANTRGTFYGYTLNAIYEKYYGHRPFQMWEPYDWFGWKNTGISCANPAQKPDLDYYGRPFGNNRGQSYLPVGFYNGDFVSTWWTQLYTVTDPDTAWTNDAAINETIIDYATANSVGSISSNYLRLQKPSVNIVAGQNIQAVWIRPLLYMTDVTGEFHMNFYTENEAENLGEITFLATEDDSHWHTLQKIPNAPAGGWTVDDVENLEVRIWRVGASGTFRIYRIAIYIDCADHNIGAVSSRGNLQVNTTDGNGSDQCLSITRAGFYQTTCPAVANEEITVSVDSLIDANYSGDPPELQVYNIPGGIAEQTDTHPVSPDDTWQSMSVTFTPTLDGYATIRLVSFDESIDGETLFDNLTWS